MPMDRFGNRRTTVARKTNRSLRTTLYVRHRLLKPPAVSKLSQLLADPCTSVRLPLLPLRSGHDAARLTPVAQPWLPPAPASTSSGSPLQSNQPIIHLDRERRDDEIASSLLNGIHLALLDNVSSNPSYRRNPSGASSSSIETGGTILLGAPEARKKASFKLSVRYAERVRYASTYIPHKGLVNV